MASKTNPGNHFEDFEIGQVLDHAIGRTVTEGDNSLYIALTGDRFPIYCNAEFARGLGYERELQMCIKPGPQRMIPTYCLTGPKKVPGH